MADTTTTTAAPTIPESTTPKTTTPTPTVTPTDTPTEPSTPSSTQPTNKGTFTYKSDNANIATVSSDGKITAAGNGKTKITVTHDSLGQKTVNVEVKTKVKSISLDVTDNGETKNYNGEATPDLTNKISIKSELTSKTIKLTPVFVSGNSHKVTDGYQKGTWTTSNFTEIDKISYSANGNVLSITLLPGAKFTTPLEFKHSSSDCGTITFKRYLTVTQEYTSFSVSPESVVLFTNGDNTEQITTTFS